VIRDGEGAECHCNLAGPFAFAVVKLVTRSFDIYDNGIIAKQRVRIFGGVGLELGKSVF
jgi:hypothetical protein